jgi:hypothetical protein
VIGVCIPDRSYVGRNIATRVGVGVGGFLVLVGLLYLLELCYVRPYSIEPLTPYLRNLPLNYKI